MLTSRLMMLIAKDWLSLCCLVINVKTKARAFQNLRRKRFACLDCRKNDGVLLLLMLCVVCFGGYTSSEAFIKENFHWSSTGEDNTLCLLLMSGVDSASWFGNIWRSILLLGWMVDGLWCDSQTGGCVCCITRDTHVGRILSIRAESLSKSWLAMPVCNRVEIIRLSNHCGCLAFLNRSEIPVHDSE